jgi:hypothetical protein
MDGQPVWLASVSIIRKVNGIIGTADWPPPLVDRMQRRLENVLGGVGDSSQQRSFRMNVTLCRHRALTAEEVAGLPAYFHADPPIDLAGGPVEILWENVPGRASTQPCLSPEHRTMDPYRLDLWIPGDCGECAPCEARAEIESYCGVAG